MKRALSPWLVAVALVSGAAQAEDVRVIDSARVRLGDVVDTGDAELGELDLGDAPPAGASRKITRDELRRRIDAAGLADRRVRLPADVRVKSAGRRVEPAGAEALFGAPVRAALPRGVSLKKVRLARAITVSPRASVGQVVLAKLPRRAGTLRATARVELVRDGELHQVVPVALELELGEEALLPLVAKGTRVELAIERGSARISAGALALSDLDQGEVGQFKVEATGKILRGRVLSRTAATVVAP